MFHCRGCHKMWHIMKDCQLPFHGRKGNSTPISSKKMSLSCEGSTRDMTRPAKVAQGRREKVSVNT